MRARSVRARAAAALAPVLAVALLGLLGGCALYEKARKAGKELSNPYETQHLTEQQEIALIDSMRAKGSYEAARQRLNNTARVIGERISAAVPGQTWKFDDDPNLIESARAGLSCYKLSDDIATRPIADTVRFGRTFTANEFTTAAGIVREEAAKYGATDQSSLFNEASKRDYTVSGNGYDFNLGQINFATLNIYGACFLHQRVLDSPPGRLPPPTTTAPGAPTPSP
ncbi:LppA family lipoprotein [Mycobacterium botniense]|uniref:LppA family lipoprotein n=1 Tax=Mycobacterium botniense TaxID=84962 RepID=UPI0013D5DE63|nr:LppA family lipoprotein [Mycobacterium botniense]